MTVWAASLIGVSIASLILAFARVQTKTSNLRSKLQIIKGTRTSDGTVDIENAGFAQRVILPLFRQFAGKWGKRLSKVSPGDVPKRLMLSGNKFSLSVEHFYAIKVVSAAVMPVLLATLMNLMQLGGSLTLVWIGVGFLVGWILPEIILDQTIRKRQAEILNELPGVLDIFTVTTEAGLTFEAAMKHVCKTTEGVLVDEFKKVIEDTDLNRRRSDALRDMAERCGVEDLSVFVKSVITAEQKGASGIANAIRMYSKDARDKLRQRVEEKGSKSAVALLFPTVLFTLPALFIVVLGSAMIDIVKNFG